MQARSIEFWQVRQILPYEPPMIMVDRVSDWNEEGWIVVEKVISGADPLNAGHFPTGPSIAPGILLIEIVCQAGVLLESLLADPSSTTMQSVGVTSRVNAIFHRAVRVGDTVLAKVTREVLPLEKCLLRGALSVGSESVAEIKIYAAVM